MSQSILSAHMLQLIYIIYITLSLIFAKSSIKYTHRNCLYILWWPDLHGWWETDDGGGTTVVAVAVAVAAAAVDWLWPIKQIINYLSAAAAVTVAGGEFAFSNQLSLHVILSCQRGFIYKPQLQLQAIALRKCQERPNPRIVAKDTIMILYVSKIT